MSTSDVKSARGGASTVATSRRTGATTQNTTNRLNSMADNMNNFYGDLDEETTIRKQAEEQRVVRLERELGKIERVISTETKRRIEASKVLQTMFEEKLIAMQKEFREELHATYSPLQAQIDLLTVRVEKLEQTMIEERKNREAEIQKANKELLDKFSEHVKQFEVEKVSRRARRHAADVWPHRISTPCRCRMRNPAAARPAATRSIPSPTPRAPCVR